MKHPPFCPEHQCKNHNIKRKNMRWYIKIGFYNTKVFNRVQRFKCKSCKQSFSEQIFSIDYYAKKKVKYQRLLNQLKSVKSIRKIANNLNISAGTVTNKITRLSSQAIHKKMKSWSKSKLLSPVNLTTKDVQNLIKYKYYSNSAPIHCQEYKEKYKV